MKIINNRQKYSDKYEEQLFSIISEIEDYSLTSEELKKHIVDWVSTYHLSLERCNLLEPISFFPGMKILDLGGGTGLLTEYMAEKGAHVTLLEGELNRAKVAEVRCRRFKNVEIIVGGVEDVDFFEKFDLILIVGVLEYIGQNNSKSWLSRVRKMLKSNGILALAIENKLGVKYFLGYPEDHTGLYFDGLVNYSSKDTPRTYHKKELTNLLNDSGLEVKKWFYPFPDYKLPTTILSDSIFLSDKLKDASQLIKKCFSETGNKSLFNFDEYAILNNLESAGLIQDLANSFFVLAGPGNIEDFIQNDCLAYILDSNYRRSIFRKAKKLYETPELIWNVEKQFPKSSAVEGKMITQRNGNYPYVNGKILGHILKSNYQNNLDFSLELISGWLKSVYNSSSSSEVKSEFELLLPCNCNVSYSFDYHANNFIYSEERLICIDTEWVLKIGICVEFIILNALYETFIDYDFFASYENIWELVIGEFKRVFDKSTHLSLTDFAHYRKVLLSDIIEGYTIEQSKILNKEFIQNPTSKNIPFNYKNINFLDSYIKNMLV